MAGSSDEEYQHRENQNLFEATQHPGESLAQWAARLTKLGNDAGYGRTQLRDKLLRDKFISGLIHGPMKMMFQMKPDIHTYTFKQVLDFAFTTATEMDLYDKKMAKQEEQKKRLLDTSVEVETYVNEATRAAEAKRAEEELDKEIKEYFGDSD